MFSVYSTTSLFLLLFTHNLYIILLKQNTIFKKQINEYKKAQLKINADYLINITEAKDVFEGNKFIVVFAPDGKTFSQANPNTFKITASLQDARELCDRKSSETARVLGSHEWTMWLT